MPSVHNLSQWIQSIPSYTSYLRSILILSSHMPLRLPNVIFPLCFQTKNLYPLLISPMPRPYLSSKFDHRNNIWWRVSQQVMNPIITQLCLVSGYFLPLTSKYSPTHQVGYWNTPVCSSLNVRDKFSHPYKTTGKLQSWKLNFSRHVFWSK
jgi:hypothetical protein